MGLPCFVGIYDSPYFKKGTREMNERIKELIKQATTIEEHGWGASYDNFDKEKFAELIVRECGVALSPMLRDMVSRGQAYDMINRHFGVEE